MEPGGRQPAPGALALIQAFINTRDIEAQREDLSTPERLRAWFAEHELLPSDAAVGEVDLRRAVELREALRAQLAVNHGAPVSAELVERLNGLAATLPLLVQFAGDEYAHLQPAGSGVDGALARMLAIVYTAVVEDTWVRLKVCPADTCRWAFYDSSKNRSGTWCTMAVCGNRNKVRAYQQRRRAAAGER